MAVVTVLLLGTNQVGVGTSDGVRNGLSSLHPSRLGACSGYSGLAWNRSHISETFVCANAEYRTRFLALLGVGGGWGKPASLLPRRPVRVCHRMSHPRCWLCPTAKVKVVWKFPSRPPTHPPHHKNPSLQKKSNPHPRNPRFQRISKKRLPRIGLPYVHGLNIYMVRRRMWPTLTDVCI